MLGTVPIPHPHVGHSSNPTPTCWAQFLSLRVCYIVPLHQHSSPRWCAMSTKKVTPNPNRTFSSERGWWKIARFRVGCTGPCDHPLRGAVFEGMLHSTIAPTQFTALVCNVHKKKSLPPGVHTIVFTVSLAALSPFPLQCVRCTSCPSQLGQHLRSQALQSLSTLW